MVNVYVLLGTVTDWVEPERELLSKLLRNVFLES